MELKIVNQQNQEVGMLKVKEEIFAREYNEALIHQVVTGFLANARSGNRAQKTRSEIAKSTRKPWKQKGTGRARAGMASSPIWRGGGRAFPNSPEENFTQKINRKMYRAAMSSILSQLIRDNRFIVADNISVDAPKTKNFIKILKDMALINDKVLLVVDELKEEVWLSSRNLPNVLIIESHQIDPYSLLYFNKVIFLSQAVEKVQESLS